MEQQSRAVIVLKRILAISIILITTVFIVYSCSAMNYVSNYKYNLLEDIGSIYEDNDEKCVLKIMSEKEIFVSSTFEEYTATYEVEQKENLLLLTKTTTEETTVKIAFLALSAKELFWQTKNIILYKLENE